MKLINIIVLLAIIVIPLVMSVDLSPSEIDQQWTQFKRKFKKSYMPNEELTRKSVFEENLKDIIQHNLANDLKKTTWRKGVTKFADLTKHEFVTKYIGHIRVPKTLEGEYHNASSRANPRFVDWRRNGIVTRVQDQGRCGSDWAFSAVASLEGQSARKTGRLVELSEQNLVDCSSNNGNYGCRGGWMDRAFEYIRRNNGINTEVSYPYRGLDAQCRFDPRNIGAKVSGYVYIRQYSERDLEEATARIGPISVAVDATDFQFYQYGILDSQACSQTQLNHGVTVVGYGDEVGYEYWIIKNSWGNDWGENGYIRMSRNKGNQCGIATAALYPNVS